jgi:hypothetical protein
VSGQGKNGGPCGKRSAVPAIPRCLNREEEYYGRLAESGSRFGRLFTSFARKSPVSPAVPLPASIREGRRVVSSSALPERGMMGRENPRVWTCRKEEIPGASCPARPRMRAGRITEHSFAGTEEIKIAGLSSRWSRAAEAAGRSFSTPAEFRRAAPRPEPADRGLPTAYRDAVCARTHVRASDRA